MDFMEFMRALRDKNYSVEPDGIPYFSAEGKARRRKAVKRKPVTRGEPVAGTGKWKYRMPKHYDCECRVCAPGTRTRQNRNALRFEDKAN